MSDRNVVGRCVLPSPSHPIATKRYHSPNPPLAYGGFYSDSDPSCQPVVHADKRDLDALRDQVLLLQGEVKALKDIIAGFIATQHTRANHGFSQGQDGPDCTDQG